MNITFCTHCDVPPVLQEERTSRLGAIRSTSFFAPPKKYLSTNVSGVVEEAYERMAAGQPPSASMHALRESVSRNSAFFLALAALPFTLRRVADGRIVMLTMPESLLGDEQVAARHLRNVAVVCMLDSVQSVRWLLGQEAPPRAVAVAGRDGESPVYCLPCFEVSRPAACARCPPK